MPVTSPVHDPVRAPHLPHGRLVTTLQVDPARGLTDAEALARLARWGPNVLPSDPPTPAWRRVLAQFRNVMVLLLLAATGLSVAVWAVRRDAPLPYEALAILGVVLMGAALGSLQEARAERSVAALRDLTAAQARVLRDGQARTVPAREVVPGDVLLLEEGDAVPADARLIEAVSLRTLEAALTGESLPVEKDLAPVAAGAAVGDRRDMVWSGTVVSGGRGRAVVTATGRATEVGRIAGLLRRTAPQPTPLQRELDRTGRRLGVLVLVLAAVMAATLMVVGGVRDAAALLDVLILAVALAVAAVPEGLPAITSAVLAAGTARMARRHAIVRELPAVETLGAATVIASDKTGTLTRNEMTVRTIVTASGQADLPLVTPLPEPLQAEVHGTLRAAALASNATLREVNGQWTVHGDPTEGALLLAGRALGLTLPHLPRVDERPFTSARKRLTTLHSHPQDPGVRIVFSKGAPDVLLEHCGSEQVGSGVQALTPERRAALRGVQGRLATQALRTLGVATRVLSGDRPAKLSDHAERDLVFLGLIGLIDPPRPEARAAVALARQAGIRVVMITGDHPATALAIATDVGIAGPHDPVLTGAQLNGLPEADLERAARHTCVYARVDPEHKLRIVQALQRGGAVVAMTGDGVNDAPALKAADIGVAMGLTGTDVSREAADIVLADDNFATIVAAVQEGRGIFENIRKFLRYLLSSNIGEVLTMFLGVVLSGVVGLRGPGGEVALPLLASQILWINLVTDGAPALALGLDPAEAGVMRRPPRPLREGVITPAMWRGILLAGLVLAIATLGVLDAWLPGGLIPGTGDLTYARTMAFTTLMAGQLFNVWNARSDTRSARQGVLRNRWLWGAVALSVGLHLLALTVPALQAAFGTVPLSLADWGWCLAAASFVLWVREVQKWVERRQGGLNSTVQT